MKKKRHNVDQNIHILREADSDQRLEDANTLTSIKALF